MALPAIPEMVGDQTPTSTDWNLMREAVLFAQRTSIVYDVDLLLPSTNFTSSSFADFTGGSVAVTKYYGFADTVLEVSVDLGGYLVATAPCLFHVGVLVDGDDIELGHFNFNTVSEHHAFSFGGTLELSAGAYTVQARCRVGTTPHTIACNSEDTFHLRVTESARPV